jgi:hypothetical protein
MRRAALRACCALSAVLPASAAEYLGSHPWRPGWHGAGGYSALWLAPDGRDFVALSDRGAWVEGRLARDEAGAVEAVETVARGKLLHSTGRRLDGDETDAEGIARVGDGFYVSFEGLHRVMHHADGIDAAPRRIDRPEGFEAFGVNAGLEALAAAPDGTLYAVPEKPDAEGLPFDCWRYDGERWEVAFTLRREGRFRPVSADLFEGRLYLLERDFAMIGFRSRLRSFDLAGGDERTEFESGLGAHDNLEGLSIWRDAGGVLRATMISDDNLRAPQRTEFVDYRLDP